MKAMILAAGQGTRLRPFTVTTPKPAIPFLGVPLLAYVVSLAKNVGVNDFVINVHHLPEKIRGLVSDLKIKAEFSDETKILMDSGGGVNQAKKFLANEENFLVINGDEIILPNSDQMMQSALDYHLLNKNLATLCVKRHPEVGSAFGGAWVNPKASSPNQIIQFSKTKVSNLEGWHYTGIIFLNKNFFRYASAEIKPENILYDILTRAIASHEKVEVYPIDCEWFEVGNPNDFIQSTKICLEKIESLNRSDKLDKLNKAEGLGKSNGWPELLKKFLKNQNFIEPIVEKSDDQLFKKTKKILSSLNNLP